MEKKKVRCLEINAQVSPNNWNYTVLIILNGGWANNKLFTCINCGELYVLDWDNIIVLRKSLESIVNEQKCCNCNNPLKITLKQYPKFIWLKNGEIGHFEEPAILNIEEDKTIIIELYEIKGNV